MSSLEANALPPVVFLHIPKTGGTSLHHMLLPHFSPEEVCPERFPGLDKYSREDIRGYRFFSGHYDRHDISLIPNPRRVVTLLREPHRRIISLYRFWRAHRWNTIIKYQLDGPRIAKTHGFKEFLLKDDEGIPANVDNYVTRSLLGRRTASGCFPRRRFIYPDDEVVERACAYLDSLDACAIMELFDETVPGIFKIIGLPVPDTLRRDNALEQGSQTVGMDSIDKLVIDTETHDILDKLTWADRQVYDHAFARISKQIPR